jgi:hypothetical protein
MDTVRSEDEHFDLVGSIDRVQNFHLIAEQFMFVRKVESFAWERLGASCRIGSRDRILNFFCLCAVATNFHGVLRVDDDVGHSA